MDYLKRGLNLKSGQGLSINAIILILLGVVVLVLLIVGFTTGGKNFFGLIGNKDNVDTVKRDCNTACLSQSQFSFCQRERTIQIDGKEVAKGTCVQFSLDEERFGIYGIEKCSQISCPAAN